MHACSATCNFFAGYSWSGLEPHEVVLTLARSVSELTCESLCSDCAAPDFQPPLLAKASTSTHASRKFLQVASLHGACMALGQSFEGKQCREGVTFVAMNMQGGKALSCSPTQPAKAVDEREGERLC